MALFKKVVQQQHRKGTRFSDDERLLDRETKTMGREIFIRNTHANKLFIYIIIRVMAGQEQPASSIKYREKLFYVFPSSSSGWNRRSWWWNLKISLGRGQRHAFFSFWGFAFAIWPCPVHPEEDLIALACKFSCKLKWWGNTRPTRKWSSNVFV